MITCFFIAPKGNVKIKVELEWQCLQIFIFALQFSVFKSRSSQYNCLFSPNLIWRCDVEKIATTNIG